MKNNSVTKEQARIAAERLLNAVWADSGVSLRLARFLLSAHSGHSNVDFSLFPSLDQDNLAAAQVVMQYSIFQRQFDQLLEWDDFEEVRDFWESRTQPAA
ncbi:hypothetical protein [Ruegeria arenilitoris]|uniref:Uncharacterized protein n=1 Tax=Ruegeria arenilitoris TaxID=1173585 RepID=A0A238KGQ8_9RHOB|nr:hypothetical protein [Ruegeria arenilitoris]SMX41764.1 hypothetical protein RUA8715_02094 [Ruegeria arenilitoris]